MRLLRIAVVVMGVLIVAGTVALVVVLVQRASSRSPASAGPATLDEPPGTRIVGASAAQDRVAVQLQGGGPDRVVVVDTRTGRVVARVALAR